MTSIQHHSSSIEMMEPLRDNHRRVISYLRVSVTDRCNFRCTYCMPARGVSFVDRDALLTFEEIERVARVGMGLGLTKIRLTGGEPCVRRDLPRLVGMLASLNGLRELAMTTNASRLGELAEPLKHAGLGRVNISLDTLRRERALKIARRDVFDDVMRGVEEVVRVGLMPLKFNCVAMRGVNDDELCELALFAHQAGGEMRFIEYMPMGQARLDERNKTITAAEMLARLRERFDFVPDTEGSCAGDPARGYVCRRTAARVGFITSMSDHFCGGCNRMRLTAEGALRPCLHQNAEVDVRSVLRGGGTDDDVADAFYRAAQLKWAGHHMNAFVPIYSRREMVSLGG